MRTEHTTLEHSRRLGMLNKQREQYLTDQLANYSRRSPTHDQELTVVEFADDASSKPARSTIGMALVVSTANYTESQMSSDK